MKRVGRAKRGEKGEKMKGEKGEKGEKAYIFLSFFLPVRKKERYTGKKERKINR